MGDNANKEDGSTEAVDAPDLFMLRNSKDNMLLKGAPHGYKALLTISKRQDCQDDAMFPPITGSTELNTFGPHDQRRAATAAAIAAVTSAAPAQRERVIEEAIKAATAGPANVPQVTRHDP
jgi:hypothetical protein